MNKGLLAALGVAALVSAGTVAAQGRDERGFYLGASGGMSQYKDVCKRSAVPCDDTDTALRGFAGYQFNRNWQLEFGAGNFGEATGSGAVSGGTGSFNWESYAFDLTGLGHIYVASAVSVFGRLGLYMGRTTVDQEAPGLSQHDAKTNSGLTYGLGAQLTLGHLGIRAEWQRYDNIGTNTLGTDEVDLFMLGAYFRF